MENYFENDKNVNGELKEEKERIVNILMLDDEEVLVKLYKYILENHGCNVIGYSNPKDALEDFKSRPNYFDIVITDQSMPNISGIEFASEILLIRRNIKIVVCSGYIDRIDKEKAEYMGITSFLEKPFNIKKLIKTVYDLFSLYN